jgi:hypothetical protein
MGQQDNTQGYIVFGSTNSTNYIGRSGSNPITVTGAFNVTGTTNLQGTTNGTTINATTIQGGTIGNSGATLTGTLSTAAQTNITSVGILTGLVSSANITAQTANVYAANIIGNTAIYGAAYYYANGLAFTGGGGGSTSPGGANTMVQFNNSGSFAGATYLQYNITSGNLVSNSTTTSISTTTGAIVVAGGMGIGGNLYVGGNLSIAGNTTFINTTTITTTDTIAAPTINANVVGNTGSTHYGTIGTNAQPYITSVGTLGNLSVTSNIAIGSSLNYTPLNGLLQVGYNANNYIQIILQNANSGINASTDIAAVANNGSDNDTFVNMGITSSTYNQSAYNLYGANDGYLIVSGNTTTQGGNLIINTYSTKDIVFATGGTLKGNEIGRFRANTNSFVVSSTTASNSTTTGSLIANGGAGISGNVYVGGNIYTQQRTGYTYSGNSTSVAYTYYNATTGSLDTVFG